MTTLRHKIMDMDAAAPFIGDTLGSEFAGLQWRYGFSLAQAKAACLAAEQDAVVMALADALQDLVAAAEDYMSDIDELVAAKAVLAEVGGK